MKVKGDRKEVHMEQDDLIRFGAYIKKLREIEGLSQEELAKRSGFAGRAAISAIEKGKNNISIDKLPSLAHFAQHRANL